MGIEREQGSPTYCLACREPIAEFNLLTPTLYCKVCAVKAKTLPPIVAALLGPRLGENTTVRRAIAIHHSQSVAEVLHKSLADQMAIGLKFDLVPAEEVLGTSGIGRMAIFAEGPARNVDDAETWAAGFLDAVDVGAANTDLVAAAKIARHILIATGTKCRPLDAAIEAADRRSK